MPTDAIPPGPALRRLSDLHAALAACRRRALYRNATQAVDGNGPAEARLMLVGEQPGDQEDRVGRPFVGPAGALLDRALEEAEIDRRDVYVTNAVKHFKNEPQGKRRLHRRPDRGEVRACRWWLTEEIRLVQPRLIVALGATAAASLFDRPVVLARLGGTIHRTAAHDRVLATTHPSAILRAPDPGRRAAAYQSLVLALRAAGTIL